MTIQESLSKCTIEGNTLYLPSEILPNYKDLRKALLNAGAQYKRNTFVFNTDAGPIIDKLMTGKTENIKKDYQFFETPEDLADYLANQYLYEKLKKPSIKVLEPSAGRGALIKAMRKINPGINVECYETMDINRMALIRTFPPEVRIIGDDFMTSAALEEYDIIFANPPFSKNQDIDHILHMYNHLKEDGILVSIASKHWQFAKGKKEELFRSFIDSTGADYYDIPAGRFKSSGTMVSTCFIVIQK